MTRGRGGVLANDDVIRGTTFLVNFWDFSKNFSKIFLKVYKSGQKFSAFRGNFYLNYFDGIT